MTPGLQEALLSFSSWSSSGSSKTTLSLLESSSCVHICLTSCVIFPCEHSTITTLVLVSLGSGDGISASPFSGCAVSPKGLLPAMFLSSHHHPLMGSRVYPDSWQVRSCLSGLWGSRDWPRETRVPFIRESRPLWGLSPPCGTEPTSRWMLNRVFFYTNSGFLVSVFLHSVPFP